MERVTAKEADFGDILYDDDCNIHYYRIIGEIICIEHNQSYPLPSFGDDKFIRLGKLRIDTRSKQVTEYVANISVN